MKNQVNTFLIISVVLFGSVCLFGGVDKLIQEKYKRRYENKSLFLRIPLRAEKHLIFVGERDPGTERPTDAPIRFKVGDQVRIFNLGFGGDEIKFRIGSLDSSRQTELVFKFLSPIQDAFSEQAFDRVLANTFTEGVTYTDIDDAKQKFLREQFDKMVADLAASSNTSRDFVLQSIVEKFPPYVASKREVQTLESKTNELRGELSQSAARLKRLEAEQKQAQAENNRLKSQLESLRSELGLSEGSGDLATDVKRIKQQLLDLKKAFNLKVESGKDLSRQVGDLNKASRQLQQDKAGLQTELTQVKGEHEKSKEEIKKLSRENTELKSTSEKLSRDLKTLNVKGDSLSKNYLQLQKEKDKLDDLASTTGALKAELVAEAVENGSAKKTVLIKLRELPIGQIRWDVPSEIKPGESKRANVTYSVESIDYLKVPEAERKIINSIGEKFKVGQLVSAVSEGLEVKPVDSPDPFREAQERSSVRWEWEIVNRSSQDPSFTLQTVLINKHQQQIPLYTHRVHAPSLDLVKKFNRYLQPIPIVIGVFFGFGLFGLVAIVRRAAGGLNGAAPGRKKYQKGSDYIVDKQL